MEERESSSSELEVLGPLYPPRPWLEKVIDDEVEETIVSFVVGFIWD